MTNHRPKLTRPDPEDDDYREPPAIELTSRDLKIIELVYEHRLLSSEQLYALVEGSEGSLKRRLQLLWLHQYLCRPSDQRVLRVRGDLRHLIYSLGPKGAEVLAEQKGYDIAKLNWVQKSEVNFRFISHNLFVSEFFTVLKLAIEEKEGLKLDKWGQGKEIEGEISRPDYITSKESRAEEPLLQPDGFFVIYSRKKNSRRYLFLEADRGTVRERSMLGRYKKYAAYFHQRRHRNLGIPEGIGFRVVTVTENGRRMKNLINLLEEKLGAKWLGHPEFFWFGKAIWDIDNPSPILSRCFKAPGRDKLYSIVGDGFT